MLDTWSFARLLRINTDVFVVGGWNYMAAWSALVAGALRNVPVAVISANTDQRTKLSSTFLRSVLPRFDGYFALSTDAADHLVSFGADPEKVTVLPNSIDQVSFRDRINEAEQAAICDRLSIEDDLVFLYVGVVSRAKGINDLVEAVGNMDADNLHLLIVGDGPERKEIERNATARLGEDVTFTGKRPNEELPNYYALADVFVLPTHSDTWGIVLNEAMACGTPVVTTTAAGAVGDLVQDGETGLVVPPSTPRRLRDVLQRLTTDRDERKRLTQNGSAAVKEYTPVNYAKHMKSSLEELVDGGT